ncbi:unnamed protein product [Peronospora farinosa]|uniref:Uncharacterized protein n=1 Tax=Peronospora farinosa TaxID=134698 RepID=A0ABN8C0S4_9STRA|nr:unnamed protein product [Peronospora farinosa]
MEHVQVGLASLLLNPCERVHKTLMETTWIRVDCHRVSTTLSSMRRCAALMTGKSSTQKRREYLKSQRDQCVPSVRKQVA